MVATLPVTLLAALVTAASVAAQAVNTSGVERDAGQPHAWRLAYDNDFFTATDRYFTQGLVLEVIDPRLARLPIARALFAPRGSVSRVGIAYEDDGYTPSDLKAPGILHGDHPYVGTKQFRVMQLATDTLHRRRVTSALTLGIIGQGAGGAAIQTFIHRHTGNTTPRGWVHQVRNDAIVNYEVGIEEQVARAGDAVLLTTSGVARIGTFNTAATLATTLMLGRIGTPFSVAPDRRRRVWVYLKPQLNVVGYDATLQGGVFNRSSPYTIPARDIARFVFRHQVGVVYRSGSRFIEYYRTDATREFRGALAHRSGGFLIGVRRGG
ncbi:MAG: lipid A deacylase LpxR family protein [Gemmatimonadaceae bacterium]|nr:lipid A deacylase LpxR family protein [Gemmatimonadaceae bacterium]